MRLWSISFKYLDGKGLVALWRETLLAKKVLEGGTKGYRNHPQLNRFKESADSILYINAYLTFIYDEAERRAYSFNEEKFQRVAVTKFIPVTKGQLEYELKHLQRKLYVRDSVKYESNLGVEEIEICPLFYAVPGEVEGWEVQRRK